jgi:hypothetical protein
VEGRVVKILIFLSWMSLAAPTVAAENDDPSRAYFLTQGTQYLAVKETSMGSLSYEADTVKGTHEKNELEINHKKHTQWGEGVYMIWNFAPVGVGLQFFDDPENNVAAEWEMDYHFKEHLTLNPKFTGKQKGTWSPLLGHELQFSYKYHYQNEPNPSYWDIVLRGNVVLNLLSNLRFGAFLAPEHFRLGFLSSPEQARPFPYRFIYSTGLWTELILRKTLALQFEGAVAFCEARKDTFVTKYSVASTIGVYF